MRAFGHLALILPLVISGCNSSGGGGDEGDRSSARTGAQTTVITSTQAVADETGAASASFDIPAGTNKLAIIAATDVIIGTDVVQNDLGQVYVSFDGELITLSTTYDSFVSTVNVPSRDFDPPLAGSVITMQASVAQSVDEDGNGTAAPGHPVSFSILGKQDEDLNAGALTVNLVFIGPAAGDAALKAATQQSLDVFRSIFSSQAGIDLSITQSDVGGPGVLPDPSTGDSLYLSISGAVPSPSVNICVGLDLTTPDLLGESSGIPGPPLPTVKSCVGVSGINAAGGDGEFSPEDVRILGETLAHEVGHYMGLFHPVEGDFVSFDPLVDTPTCSGEANCNAVLGANNMYYTPVGGAGGFIPQSALTPQQRGVLNRYAAVD